jgi:hypothetical protein
MGGRLGCQDHSAPRTFTLSFFTLFLRRAVEGKEICVQHFILRILIILRLQNEVSVGLW